MTKQATFASANFDAKKRQTQKEKFFAQMDKVVPWSNPGSARRASSPLGRSSWSPTHATEHDASYSFSVAMVQPVRSRDGGCAI